MSLFSKWPGAWERHLIRRHDNPQYFKQKTPPTALDIANAQSRDQQELTQFHSALESLIERSMSLTDDACSDSIASVKKELDACHDVAYGLAADLTEQKGAIAALNEILTSAMQRSSPTQDDGSRLRLIQNEAARMEQLHRLEFPIVCDLLRSVSPIPHGELSGALLSESDSAYKAALEILDKDRKSYLAQRLDTIINDLESDSHKAQAQRKLELLQKQLPDSPAPKSSAEEPVTV